MKRKSIIASIALITLFVLASTFITWNIMYRANVLKESFLYIHHKSSPDQFITIADSSGAIENLNTLRWMSKVGRLSVAEPGRYKITPGMGNREIIRLVKYGWQTPVKITISGNIRTKEKLAEVISRNIRPDSLMILEMLNNDSLARELGFDSYNLIGMFRPNTYEVFWTSSPEDIARRFKKEYDAYWNEERVNKATSLNLTLQEIVTLASIVSEESNVKSEYPIIAGVYLNRIKKKMPLQADPTVKYAVGDFTLKRVLIKHLGVESPYNTYKYSGLPPGPICIPSSDVVDGVLNRINHKYLYFCAKASLDGTHAFAATLSEHNRNAQMYQKALNRLKIR
jgi:UPF0755 protein